MKYALELDGKIAEILESIATEKGITVLELIRWILGSYVQSNQPPKVAFAFPFSGPPDPETAKMARLSTNLMKNAINKGEIKCSNCTLPLTMEDIDKGKCSQCGAEI